MKLIADNRETEVLRKINTLIATVPKNKEIKLEIKQLPVGDFIICDDENKELILVERKTISDLLASIKDNRYSEQSLRLNSLPMQNHNIIYLIEGEINTTPGFCETQSALTPAEESLIYSTIISLNIYKGFSVIRTFSSLETATFLCNLVLKITKKNKEFYYNNLNLNFDNQNKNNENNEYLNVIKIQKKENITADNINEIMLSQIPGISIITAKSIIKKYKTIYDLIKAVKNNDPELSSLKIGEDENKKRKISKSVLKSLNDYLK